MSAGGLLAIIGHGSPGVCLRSPCLLPSRRKASLRGVRDFDRQWPIGARDLPVWKSNGKVRGREIGDARISHHARAVSYGRERVTDVLYTPAQRCAPRAFFPRSAFRIKQLLIEFVVKIERRRTNRDATGALHANESHSVCCVVRNLCLRVGIRQYPRTHPRPPTPPHRCGGDRRPCCSFRMVSERDERLERSIRP